MTFRPRNAAHKINTNSVRRSCTDTEHIPNLQHTNKTDENRRTVCDMFGIRKNYLHEEKIHLQFHLFRWQSIALGNAHGPSNAIGLPVAASPESGRRYEDCGVDERKKHDGGAHNGQMSLTADRTETHSHTLAKHSHVTRKTTTNAPNLRSGISRGRNGTESMRNRDRKPGETLRNRFTRLSDGKRSCFGVRWRRCLVSVMLPRWNYCT